MRPMINEEGISLSYIEKRELSARGMMNVLLGQYGPQRGGSFIQFHLPLAPFMNRIWPWKPSDGLYENMKILG